MSLLILIFEFFKIGLFSIGGGLATLPFLYRLADKYPWFSAKQIPDMIAVSESTPGPLGINMATYTGFQHSGVIGSIAATFGLVLPSVIIIILRCWKNSAAINMWSMRFTDCALRLWG